ncbi:Uu.00g007680.m01.CDS01 [Anthostomella pinea]|uniref:Uu.00g007680.m01.CDS01 n=1 Tax=Anthostomella pinea TaxID=933095 RepID=A0AAI8YPQ5_9PEZI|nr:Uu.00g007680.m01.CDS01 [Anthostomella pinea]
MSRDVRQKHPTTPVKVAKRRGSDTSSSLDLSDDGGYSGVEDISDSEDDNEDDVNAAEEEHILTHGVHQSIPSSPRPVEDDDDEGDDEEDDGEDDSEGDDDDAEENRSWNGIVSEPDSDEGAIEQEEQGDTVIQRRVRFDVPESSDGDSTETDDDIGNDFFPDLFVDKSTLDPSFRREIEYDHDPYDSSELDAFWDPDRDGITFSADALVDHTSTDFHALMHAMEDDDSTPVATPMTHHDLSSTAVSTPAPSPEIDDESLNGYQSDGDTTDEEDPPEKPPRRKTRREVVENDSDSDVVTLLRPRRGQPRVGRFTLDKSYKKPIAIVNPRTGKMMIFTHQNMGRGFDLSPEQFNFDEFLGHTQSSPMLSNPGNIMMSGMISSSTYGDFMNTHAVGPAEAWYSQTPDTNTIEESSESGDQLVDEEENNLTFEDFLTIDDSSEDENDDNEGDDVFLTPGRPTTSGSDMTSLLDHFEQNSNLVGAFRRDQANHQLISRSKATRESLAFSGPTLEGTLRGIKTGRLATTNVPISPLRKQKRMPEVASSPLSSLSQKRKASSETQFGHKRQRSVPDVEPLRI